MSRSLLLALMLLAGCEGAGTVSDGPPAGDTGLGVTDAAAWPDGAASPDAGGWWQPRPGTSWQIELSVSPPDTSAVVTAYDIDLFDNTASTIAALKAQGRKVICYFSAGSYEDWRPDASLYPASVLGSDLAGWPGEKWVDVRSPALRQILASRMDLAVQKGCDCVDPDNVDGYQNANGLGLKAADQLDFNQFLAATAHTRGLCVGLKNDIDQIPDLVGDFDFTVNEQCFQYGECDKVTPFVQHGKPVFNIEYGSASLAQTVCPKSVPLDFDTLIKNMSLDAARVACR